MNALEFRQDQLYLDDVEFGVAVGVDPAEHGHSCGPGVADQVVDPPWPGDGAVGVAQDVVHSCADAHDESLAASLWRSPAGGPRLRRAAEVARTVKVGCHVWSRDIADGLLSALP